MPPPSHDRSELKQRQQELSRQLADILLSADSPVKDTAAFQKDWQQHRALCDRRPSLALLDGFIHLKGLKSLEHLDLGGTLIFDAGLMNLKGLNNLEFLSLRSSQITDAAVAQLQRALPNCEIEK